MQFEKRIGVAVVVATLLVALGGCQKPEGPAEHAGKEIDKAVDKAGQQIEKAGDSIQKTAQGDKK